MQYGSDLEFFAKLQRAIHTRKINMQNSTGLMRYADDYLDGEDSAAVFSLINYAYLRAATDGTKADILTKLSEPNSGTRQKLLQEIVQRHAIQVEKTGVDTNEFLDNFTSDKKMMSIVRDMDWHETWKQIILLSYDKLWKDKLQELRQRLALGENWESVMDSKQFSDLENQIEQRCPNLSFRRSGLTRFTISLGLNPDARHKEATALAGWISNLALIWYGYETLESFLPDNLKSGLLKDGEKGWLTKRYTIFHRGV